jgi:hypothetical protein
VEFNEGSILDYPLVRLGSGLREGIRQTYEWYLEQVA